MAAGAIRSQGAAPRARARPSLRHVQRLLLLAIGLLVTGSLVCVYEMNLLNDEVLPTFLARSRHSLRWQARSSNQPSLREFFQERSSVHALTADQEEVIRMTRHAWRGYRRRGQWRDHLNVVNMTGATVYAHDMAFTLVDSLDTLFIMGLHDEFDEASEWARTHLRERMLSNGSVSFFETTIRSLGGLLSAHYLSQEEHFLDLAAALGDALAKTFVCGMFVPCQHVDLQTHEGGGDPSLAEANSFQLEFTYLSRLVEDGDTLVEHVKHMNEMMHDMTTYFYEDGLVPLYIDWEAQRGFSAQRSVGALGDSYYEYLLKQWLLSGKKDNVMKQRYLNAVEGMKTKLLGRSTLSQWAFLGSLTANHTLVHRMEHLTCFVPGMLALGTFHGLPQSHLDLAKELIETCMLMYTRTSTKLSPEVVYFQWKPENVNETAVKSDSGEMWVRPSDNFNALRPETVESLMVLYRVTKDDKYRTYGRDIMTAIETNSKLVDGGYRSTDNVLHGPVQTYGRDMESFFIAETLKYLFLLFSEDDILPLDAVVFNTEGHPFPIC